MAALAISSQSSSRDRVEIYDRRTSAGSQSLRGAPSISWSSTIAWAPFDEMIRQQFLQLADTWRRETSHVSQVERRVLHPSYQRIIALGQPVLPFMLQELNRHPDHWFWALRILADEDPIPANFRGSMGDAVRLWVNWGRKVGYI